MMALIGAAALLIISVGVGAAGCAITAAGVYME